ncbi:hypothetical protein BCR34DRAFT_625132 [Clohesyomyces aquaticus]|uniref:Phospho-2-dehydro-3-deoxyheptonate aldolase n=1 Tax=Clohesyomyces aquaticus TaxID=1231657 RepID=A0A1Y1ZL64_9PLEO|nr:hypothetical protein BCR34DRAFT_625132 [Clohesyomyces aquaticus]
MSSKTETTPWSVESWKVMPLHEQIISYQDKNHLQNVLKRLAELPPLVSPTAIESAREDYAAAARGEAFILVAGDCAESFEDTTTHISNQKVALLISQARHFEGVMGLPVHITARMAGQYSKPRSQLLETLADGVNVFTFRGHNVNGHKIQNRTPNPDRLLQGYWHSVATLHLLQTAMTQGNYDRTRHLDGAHLEYLRGLRNPVGVKLGPSTSPEEVLEILAKLCEQELGEDGRVTLITRLGAEKVGAVLPVLVEAVQASPFRPVWMCDPCHGNTFTKDGVKTRQTSTMLSEVAQTIRILSRFGAHLGGLHLEQTSKLVTECIGLEGVDDGQFPERYSSLCDPRLSCVQARWLIERVASLLSQASDTEENAVVKNLWWFSEIGAV